MADDGADEYDAEADWTDSWWLAHRIIGDEVRAGRRPLPEMFRTARTSGGPLDNEGEG